MKRSKNLFDPQGELALRSHETNCAQRHSAECNCGAFEHNEAISNSPHVIKGPSGGLGGKWEEVQAIQNEPFIYIQYNGSRFLGEEADDVAVLLDMLKSYSLGEYWRENCATLNPCSGVVNPEWDYRNLVPHFIAGPRLYAADGVWRFSGNFDNYSHAFSIDTNHKATIAALLTAIAENDAVRR